MALPGQPLDPSLVADLYGVPAPTPAAPVPAPEPWSWVPDSWRAAPVEQAPAELAPPPIVPVSDELPGLPPPIPAGFPAAPIDGLAGAPVPPPNLGPPPMPEPDAISGAAPFAPAARVADLPGLSITTDAPAPPRPPGIELAADDPFGQLTDAQAFRAVEQTDPATLARLEVDRERRRQIAASAALLKADEDNLEAIKQNIEARRIADEKTQAEMNQITADAMALSRRPLDRGRWFRDLGVGGKIAAAIGAIVGGLMSKPGGPNYGVDFIAKHIDDDIADQKYDIENARQGLEQRRGAVAAEFARHGNLFQAAETVRQATYQAVIRKMEIDQQNFDPRGTSFIEYGKRIAEMRAKDAAAREAQRRVRFEENHKTAQYDLEVEKFEAQKQREAKAAEARASAARSAKQVWSPEQLAVLNPGLPKPPIAMTQADYAKWLGTQKVGAELDKAQEDALASRRRNDPNERAREFGVGGIVDDQGTPVLFRNAETATKVADLKGAADASVALIDNIISARRKYGWSSDLAKSNEWRAIQADFQQLNLEKKGVDELGVIAGPDLELLHGSVGTKDPTEVRDPIAGLQRARENILNKVHTKVKAQAVLPAGRTIVRWAPPALADVPESKESPEQARLRSILGKSSETLDDVAREEIRKRRADLTPDELRDPDVYYRTAREGAAAARSVFDPDVSTKQRATIDDLELVARGPADDQAAIRAREDLEKIATKSDSVKLRKLASAALARSADPGGSPAVDQPIREVAHETVPPEPKERR